MGPISFLVDLVDMKFIFVSVRILKTVDLAGLEGLLNLLPLCAESFTDFAEILAFGDKEPRLSKVVKASQLQSAALGIRICLDSFLRFLPSLVFSEVSKCRRINKYTLGDNLI